MPPSDGAVPKWSARARSGEPQGDYVFPFDPETAGLGRGLRRVVKREARDEAEAIEAETWLRQRGLLVQRLGQVVLGARDAGELARAVEAERAGDRDPSAVRALGEALGYPRCCVEAYLALPIRDDAALFDALLPAPGAAPAPPETLWLVGPLALVSHAPCSLDCAATRELGGALLTALEAEHPAFRERWRSLARRVHVVTTQGRALCLDALGDHALRVQVADELLPPDARRVSLPELVGMQLAIEDGVLTSEDGAIVARFVADHRA